MASSPAQKLIDLVYRELDEAKGLADQGFRLIGMGQRGGWTDIVGALEYSISAQTSVRPTSRPTSRLRMSSSFATKPCP